MYKQILLFRICPDQINYSLLIMGSFVQSYLSWQIQLTPASSVISGRNRNVFSVVYEDGVARCTKQQLKMSALFSASEVGVYRCHFYFVSRQSSWFYNNTIPMFDLNPTPILFRISLCNAVTCLILSYSPVSRTLNFYF